MLGFAGPSSFVLEKYYAIVGADGSRLSNSDISELIKRNPQVKKKAINLLLEQDIWRKNLHQNFSKVYSKLEEYNRLFCLSLSNGHKLIKLNELIDYLEKVNYLDVGKNTAIIALKNYLVPSIEQDNIRPNEEGINELFNRRERFIEFLKNERNKDPNEIQFNKIADRIRFIGRDCEKNILQEKNNKLWVVAKKICWILLCIAVGLFLAYYCLASSAQLLSDIRRNAQFISRDNWENSRHKFILVNALGFLFWEGLIAIGSFLSFKGAREGFSDVSTYKDIVDDKDFSPSGRDKVRREIENAINNQGITPQSNNNNNNNSIVATTPLAPSNKEHSLQGG